MRTRIFFVAATMGVASCNNSNEARVDPNNPFLDTPEEVAAAERTLKKLREEYDADDASPKSPTQPQAAWSYTINVDPMTDKTTRTACIQSSNQVMLSSPYEPVHAELCLRDSPQFGRDAYVVLLGDGQVMCRSYEECEVRVRFDKGEPQTFPAIGASDHSTNIFFIRNRARLESQVAKAAKTIVQAEFYRAGNQAIEFNTTGFEWPN